MYTAWADKKVHSVTTNGALWKVVLEGFIAVFENRLRGVSEQSSYGSILEWGIRKSWTFESTDVRKGSSTPELHLVSQITCAENNLWTFPMTHLFVWYQADSTRRWWVVRRKKCPWVRFVRRPRHKKGRRAMPAIHQSSVRCCCLFHVSL